MKYKRWHGRQRLVALLAICCTVAYFLNVRLYSRPSSPADLPPRESPPNVQLAARPELAASLPTLQPQPDGCDAYSEVADAVIVVKTGATEAFQKLPTQLLTFLKCAGDNALFFSDLGNTLGRHKIHDALDEVVEAAKKNNPDFDLYNTQKEYFQSGNNIGELPDRSSDAWKLDKYKNIHTARKAWRLQPNKSWYFFIDADTYIVWPNFFQWLQRMDPTEVLYVGAGVADGVPPFAHGGTGYLLSGAAMALLVGEDEAEVAAKYDVDAITGCCGDQELARTLHRKGVNVTDVRPLVSGDQPRTIPFGATQWCQPLITMHHVTPEEVNSIWQYELQRPDRTSLLTASTFFHDFILPKLQNSYEEDWDNLSSDTIFEPSSSTSSTPDSTDCTTTKPKTSFSWWHRLNRPYKSFNACKKACRQDASCLQFRHHGESCALSTSIKLGAKSSPITKDDVVVRFRSGWLLDRISAWEEANSPCVAPVWRGWWEEDEV